MSSAMKESARIAYFAIFYIPGLLIIITWDAGIFFGAEFTKVYAQKMGYEIKPSDHGKMGRM